jgi:hypothetical protein
VTEERESHSATCRVAAQSYLARWIDLDVGGKGSSGMTAGSAAILILPRRPPEWGEAGGSVGCDGCPL